jgi:hypothetical protein
MPQKSHMTKTEKIWLSVSILVALIGLVVGTFSYFFGVKVISTGEAYGFQVGDSREKTYENAQKLLGQKKIVAIHTWPKDQFHRPFETTENPDQNTDPKWVMVVNRDWWNNSIAVTFENNAVIEIRRDKIYSELP